MGNRFAVGAKAIATCDRCGQQFKLRQLKQQIIKQKSTNLLVCRACLDKDHPQLMLGMFPVDDPQALRNPRRDNSYLQSGLTNDGSIGEGSRNIQWGWAPVGGGDSAVSNVPNNLVATCAVGTVSVT